jgi:predicted phosphodiesterase
MAHEAHEVPRMKLLILSDLHLEMAPFKPPEPAVRQADVIVLAGDIHIGTQGLAWAAGAFRGSGKPVVYVAGNHEFYSGHWDDTLAHLRVRARELGIHFLENDAVILHGVRFLGCSLWTDFEIDGAQQRDAAMRAALKSMNDYRLIHVDSTSVWLTPQHTLERHRESRAWLAGALADPAFSTSPTVVVTHHLPCPQSVMPWFVGDPLNPSYASDLPEALLTQADLWIHGHTHDSAAYAIGQGAKQTRVVCNPRGYPQTVHGFQNMEFDAGSLVSV